MSRGRLGAITVEGEMDGFANFAHSSGAKIREPFSEEFLWNRHEVMEVHGARRFHSIRFIEQYFSGNTAPSGGYGSDGDLSQL